MKGYQAQFLAHCRTCEEPLGVSLAEAKQNSIVQCTKSHKVGAREAITDDLVKRMNMRSEWAFEFFVEIFESQIKTTIGETLGRFLPPDLSLKETEDATQELYLDLWKNGIPPIAVSFRALIVTIAKHKAFDTSRKKWWTKGRHVEINEQLLTSPRGRRNCEETLVISKIDHDTARLRLDEAVKCLSPRLQTVYTLRRTKNQNIKQVARELGIGVGAVKSALHKAETQVKALMLTAKEKKVHE